jgi:D-serine deaminase-like pyridoxal phosphate-dependent protein
MNLPVYPLADVATIPSPAVIVYRHLLEHNLGQILAIAGSPERLRPHCKTHKTREIVRMLLDRGVTRHKCATLREAMMCIEAGAQDVVIAYQMVGPAIEQLAELAAREPSVRLAALVDSPQAAEWLSAAAIARGVTIGAMVDLDTGAHRTGMPVGTDAEQLYLQVTRLPGLRPAGLHVYDSQNNKHAKLEERCAAVERTLEPVMALADALRRQGCAVPEILCGGTGTFPCYARYGSPILCSPGTAVFWDEGYSEMFPDLDARFQPAALLLGRVVSRPTADHVTLDLGSKAIAADPPMGNRGLIIGMEDAVTKIHNEEHWTVSSAQAQRFHLGDAVLVVPRHVCPNANLYPLLYVLDQEGHVAERWDVAARHRPLTM